MQRGHSGFSNEQGPFMLYHWEYVKSPIPQPASSRGPWPRAPGSAAPEEPCLDLLRWQSDSRWFGPGQATYAVLLPSVLFSLEKPTCYLKAEETFFIYVFVGFLQQSDQVDKG